MRGGNESGSDWFGVRFALFHCVVVLIAGTALLISNAPNWRVWTNGTELIAFLTAAPTRGMAILFLCSAGYFVIDSLRLIASTLFAARNPQRIRHETVAGGNLGGVSTATAAGVVLLIHHTLCTTALVVSVASGFDSGLILLALLIGEIPNPPRLSAQILFQSDKSHSSRTAPNQSDWNLTLSNAHFVLFIATRFIGLQFAFRVVWAYAVSSVTIGSAIGLCGVSAAAIYQYIRVGGGVHSTFPSTQHRSDMLH